MSKLKCDRAPFKPTPPVRFWFSMLARASTHQNVAVGTDDLVRLAALITLVDPPNDARAYNLLRLYLLQKHSCKDLGLAVRMIPPEQKMILRVVDCLAAYESVVRKSVGEGGFKLEQIKVMLEIPSPEIYVRHLYERGFKHYGAIFHPRSLERAKGELRGVFVGSMPENYMNTALSKIKVVQ